MSVVQGVHHVGLTVLDAEQAAAFFVEALEFEVLARRPAYPAVFVGNGAVMLTLWQVAAAAPFDRRGAVGLHHLALAVPDRAALDRLHHRLAERTDVAIEFGPEPVGAAHHMMFAGPSGLRLELFWAGA